MGGAASLLTSALWPASSSSSKGTGHASPSRDDCHAIYTLLVSQGLPAELAASILEAAEFFPMHVTTLRGTNRSQDAMLLVRSSDTGAQRARFLLVSQPVPAAPGGQKACVGKIEVWTDSRDQGFSDFRQYHGTREGSSSWFEAVLMRQHTAAWDPMILEDDEEWPPSGPKNLRVPPSLRPYGIIPGTHTRLHCNLHAVRSFNEFATAFTATSPGPGGRLVRRAREGDRILVYALAEYPAWVNLVRGCEIRVGVRAV
ncbi:hypothetical protein JCM10207_008180 [Rhodosporidiobolus poonsookiae]